MLILYDIHNMKKGLQVTSTRLTNCINKRVISDTRQCIVINLHLQGCMHIHIIILYVFDKINMELYSVHLIFHIVLKEMGIINR